MGTKNTAGNSFDEYSKILFFYFFLNLKKKKKKKKIPYGHKGVLGPIRPGNPQQEYF